MRALSIVLSVLLAGSAFAQDPAAVYTPAGRDLSVPTFINATVTRVNTRNNTISFGSESGEVSLTVEGAAVSRLGRLRAGDDVLLGYRIDSRSGRPVQVVTAILAGEEMAQRGVRASTSPTAAPAFSTISGRVIRTDAAAGTITLVDAEGRTEMLAVDRSISGSLGSVLPGDQVDVRFVPGAPVGVTGVFGTVNAIQPVTPTFATGRVTSFDAATGALRLQTPFGTSAFTLPSGRFDARSVTVGQDIRLDLTGRGASATVTGLSALGGVTTRTRTVTGTGTFNTPLSPPGGTTTVASGARPGGVVSGSVTTFGPIGAARTSGAAGVVQGTGALASGTVGVVTGTTGAAAPTTTATLAGVLPGNVGAVAGGAFNTVGLNGVGVNAGLNTADVAAPGTFSTPGSPFSAVVPSLPSVVGQLNVVPPPQSAPALADVLPVGAARDFATRDYDNAVRTLALKANEIDAHWFRYRDGCLRTSALTADIDRGLFATNRDREWFVLFGGDVRTPADDNCRQLMIEMTRMANDWRDLMNRMEETARKNDVLPGAMRESRQRYRVEF